MYIIIKGNDGIRIFNSFSFEIPEDKDRYDIVVDKFEAYFNPNSHSHFEVYDGENLLMHRTEEKPSMRSGDKGDSIICGGEKLVPPQPGEMSPSLQDPKSQHFHTGEKPHYTHTVKQAHVTHTGEKPHSVHTGENTHVSECVARFL